MTQRRRGSASLNGRTGATSAKSSTELVTVNGKTWAYTIVENGQAVEIISLRPKFKTVIEKSSESNSLSLRYFGPANLKYGWPRLIINPERVKNLIIFELLEKIEPMLIGDAKLAISKGLERRKKFRQTNAKKSKLRYQSRCFKQQIQDSLI